jgi:hypothetical protein
LKHDVSFAATDRPDKPLPRNEDWYPDSNSSMELLQSERLVSTVETRPATGSPDMPSMGKPRSGALELPDDSHGATPGNVP